MQDFYRRVKNKTGALTANGGRVKGCRQIGAWVAAALLTFPPIVMAQQCDAWYRFNGDLADANGGVNGEMIGAEGAAATPSFTEGVDGQALTLDGTSAMRSFLYLHPDKCRQFTFSGWLRMDPSVTSTQWVLATGGGGRPGLRTTTTMATLGGSGNGLSERFAIRDPRVWFFFAGVYDYAAGTYRLHWRERTVEGRLPESPGAFADAFWVGALNPELHYAVRNAAIDELRIIGRALSATEIERLRGGRPSAFVLATNTPAVAGTTSGIPRAVPGISDRLPPVGPAGNAEDLADRRQTPPLLPGGNVGTATGEDDNIDNEGAGTASNPTDPLLRPIGGRPDIEGVQDLEEAIRPRDPLLPSTTETLDCRIDAERTLKNSPAAIDYIADCVVDVTAALTIEPGVVIQFGEDAGLGIFDNGSISAVGTAAQPIVLQGQSVGWRGVYVGTKSLSNALENVRIEDAGSNYVYCCRQAASLVLEGAQIGLKNVHLSKGEQLGILALEDTQFTRYSGIRIESHKGYAASMNWDILSDLDGTGSDYSGNDKDFVFVSSDRIIEATTVKKLNVPYLLTGDVVDITAALTFEAGVEVVVMENGGLGVYDEGSLTANGTAADAVIFRGADASPGFWRGIHTETASSNNSLRNVEIRHAGSNYVYCCNEAAALLVKGGQMTLENSTISDSGGCGVSVGAGASLLESGNTFSSNQGGDRCNPTEQAEVGQGTCMIGSVKLFSGNYPPRGWAYANGNIVGIQAFSSLYSVIGTTYGGDGQTNFALPNIPGTPATTSGTSAIICAHGMYPSRS